MIGARWFARPEGEGLTLRKAPQLASWNKATDPDQVRLREYLKDTAELLAPSLMRGPWALRLDVGLPTGRNLIDLADLDNYAFPPPYCAARTWCRCGAPSDTRRPHGPLVVRAQEVAAPETTFTKRTSASSQTKAYKEQVRSSVAHATELPPGGVHLELAFVVGPRRNWLNLWKPTIDALDPLLGRTRPDRDWHPNDGRIIDLGLHVNVDSSLGHDVLITIAATHADAGPA
ncbi:hypothetical protein ACFQU3_19450 [Terrabacter sp. GCM10028922]|uniref:hypothetical protein n=1 Tax=Terrabacter sp. GCM10028922 TaxID=3273428 RepID=UPI00361653C8